MNYRVWLLPMTGQVLNDEEIITDLDISHLVIEDDTPVGKDEMDGALLRVWSISPDGYTELTPPQFFRCSWRRVFSQ